VEGVAQRGARTGDFLGGKYLLEDLLGVGGMGEVYRATNVSLGRKVAIKILSAEYVHIEEDVLRFLREARAAAAVRHQNVVDVLDVARDDDGTPFIVQELLSGLDLEHHLKERRGRLPVAEALDIMIPVADAVGAAHAQKVVHRDLKPANIFLARERTTITPKVLDFGACLFPTIAERSAKEVRMLIGTPHYMAPEQIVSKSEVDARSDVWALGVILYEILVGETPFEAESANAVLKLVKTRDVPPLRERLPDAPKELEELVARCTRRERLERFDDASAVCAELKKLRQQLGGATATATTAASIEMPSTPTPMEPIDPVGVPTTPRRLLTLSSPGSEPPGAAPEAPSGARQGDDLDLDFGLDVDVRAAPPAAKVSRPPTPAPAPPPPSAPRRAPSAPPPTPELDADSSLPPVLDPRAAAAPVRAPSAPPVPRGLELAAAAPRAPSPPAAAGPRPPAVLARDFQAVRAEQAEWSLATTLKFAAATAIPAVAGFVAVLTVPSLGVPVGRALRGDSTFASGALAVVALVCAAALCARTLLGQRKDRYLAVAAAGSVLFGIVMIIVTSSASEAAELGVPAQMGGVSSLVAPLAPLVLALGFLKRARQAWLDPYARGEALRSAALASAMLFLALSLSPVGAVRTPLHGNRPATRT
jgi:serine/threonine-protein kinase